MAYTAFALAALLMIVIPTHHFATKPYRQDEAWDIFYVQPYNVREIVQRAAIDHHPPLWRVLFKGWVEIAGHHESMTRFMASLSTLLTLALTYRLAREVSSDRSLALSSVILLGTASLFVFYSHENRQYPVLATGAVAMQLTFLRWLRRPDFKRALVFVCAGILTLYVHFIALYVLAGLAVFVLLFVRWQPGFYLRAFGLFAAVGLSFTGWLLPFLHANLILNPGGLYYALPTNGETLALIYQDLLGDLYSTRLQLLILGVLVTPALIVRASAGEAARFRTVLWRKWYVVMLPAVTLALLLITNLFQHSFTIRTLVVILPTLAVVWALGLAIIPWRAVRWVALALMCLGAAVDFKNYEGSGPYDKINAFMADHYHPNDLVVLNVGIVSSNVPFMYYFQERLPVPVLPQHLAQVILPGENLVQRRRLTLLPPLQGLLLTRIDDDALHRLQAFLGDAPRVWYVLFLPNAGEDHGAIAASMEAHYLRVQRVRIGNFAIFEYRRIPDDLRDLFVFGDTLTVRAWTFLDDVNVRRCQTVTLESWWSARSAPSDDYSMTLVLANESGQGVARSDSAPSGGQTQLWQRGAPYLDQRTLTIPCDVPAGDYPLLVGVYDPDAPAEALPITTGDGAPLGGLAYLTTLHVQP